MKKIFNFLKPYMKSVLLIVAILMLQAYCDLSLPAYTSDIVNTGIQQKGIDTKIPEQISAKDMENLLLFVSDDKKEIVEQRYDKDHDTYDKDAFILKKETLKNEEQMEELENILKKPMIFMLGMQSETKQKDMDLSILPAEQRNMMIGQFDETIKKVPDMIIDQSLTVYIKGVYESLGVNMDILQRNYILMTGCKMLALAILGMAVSICVGFLASKVAAAIGRDLRGNVFKKVVGFSNGEFDHFSTASLITRSTNDIQQIQVVIVMLLRMVLYAPIIGIGGVFKVLHTNLSMSWIIAFAVVLISMIVITLFAIAMPKFKKLQSLVDKLNLVTREILTGLQVIRAFGTEKHEEERFDDVNKELTRTNLFVNRAMTFMMPTMMLVMNGISVLIVWTGANGIDAGKMQVGDMMAFIQYTMQIIMAFLMICMISIMLPRASVSAGRVDEIIKSTTMVEDPEHPEKLSDNQNNVIFDHVSFKYPGGEDVLHDITFTAESGKTTAFIGSTGSGKSTLVNLVPRFYDVTDGKIMIGGTDIRDITQHDLREKIGYVPQKGVLFSGTIKSNILYGNKNGTDDEMIKAAETAQADSFIEEKDKLYDSVISQGGTNVSGGQKQRLSIARAIAKHPDIYIFDDSFSALDYKTDVALRKALKDQTKNSVVLIVAQRISTILHADQIIVLDEGKIAAKGTHEELLEKCEIYRQIAGSQLSESELKGGVAHA